MTDRKENSYRVGGWRSSRPWGVILALTLALALVATAFGFLAGYLPIRMFDQELWQASETSGDTARLEMIEPLIWSGRLDRLRRSDVVDLLGPPTNSNYFPDWDLVYWLGRQRGLLSLDSEWLVIQLDDRGRVAEYQVVSD